MNSTELHQLYHELYPLCRSLTGQGYRDSLAILSRYLPFEPQLYHSGSQVLDWLESHLYSYPAVPTAIPYVTSYYKPRWGLCLSQIQRNELKAPFYRVEIEVIKSSARPQDGVTVGQYVLPATVNPEQAKTVFISTYLCHSCMLNNELSGPLVQLMLYEKLKAMPVRRFNYRFIINPETIGSICYLSDHSAELKECLEYGLVLTCLAAKHDAPDTKLSFKLSRADWVSGLKGKSSPYAIDRFIRTCAPQGIPVIRPSGLELSSEACAQQAYIRSLGSVRPYDLRIFSPNKGSDERQYCSALFDLPVVQASRTVYATYPEYHSSGDDEQMFSLDSLFTSANELFALINYYELSVITPRCVEGGEPQLGKRDLYPSINSRTNLNMSNDSTMDGANLLNLIRNELSLCDGTIALFELASYLNIPLSDIFAVYQVLADKGLLTPKLN